MAIPPYYNDDECITSCNDQRRKNEHSCHHHREVDLKSSKRKQSLVDIVIKKSIDLCCVICLFDKYMHFQFTPSCANVCIYGLCSCVYVAYDLIHSMLFLLLLRLLLK